MASTSTAATSTSAQTSQSDQLMQALMGKLYALLTSGDSTVPKAKDNFISWCIPGIPFQAEDLLFAGQVIPSKGGDQAREWLLQASNFARCVNFIPDVSGIFARSQLETNFNQSGKLLWEVYQDALKYSQVSNSGDLTDEQKKRLKYWQDKVLTQTVEVTDIVTGDKETKVEDGAVVKAYTDKQNTYIEACLKYNNKRIAALNSESAADVEDWSLNADLYRMAVQDAMNAWISDGYKNQYETIVDTIHQWTQKSLVLWKQMLQDRFNEGKQADMQNEDFYYTSLWPAGFATAADGWTTFNFTHKDVSTYSSYKSNSWTAGAGLEIDGFFLGPKVNGKSVKSKAGFDLSNFSMSFDIVQVPIIRPWFSPTFLESRAWKIEPGMENVINQLSDGDKPPKGELVAYPTTAVFIRNLKSNFGELHDSASSFSKEIGLGGEVGYGVFGFSGGFSHSSGGTKLSQKVDSEGISVSGLQLIGFKCAILPKSPDPDPSITGWT